MPKDFLAEIVRERTRRNPKFPALVAEADERRRKPAVRKSEAGTRTTRAPAPGSTHSTLSTIPAPTVFFPSRSAKRMPGSIPTACCRRNTTRVRSPG